VSDQAFHKREVYFIAPDGKKITLADLPPSGTRRWAPRQKATIIMAVQHGLISVEETCTRYSLTFDEYLSWQRSFERYGLGGLLAACVQNRDRD
jgi:hypothetical protein